MEETRLAEPLARGRTADIFAWGDSQVLKLFHRGFGTEFAQREAWVTRVAWESDLTAPAVGDVIRLNGRYGIVYERLSGRSMLKALASDSSRGTELAGDMAAVHAGIHRSATGSEFPCQRTIIEERIRCAGNLPAELADKVLSSLENLPRGDRICHGDLHPGNIMLTDRGPAIIDWVDASRGNPAADLARTVIILLGFAHTVRTTSPPLRTAISAFTCDYLRQYVTLRTVDMIEFRRWLPVMAAARLCENIQDLDGWLLAEAAKVDIR